MDTNPFETKNLYPIAVIPVIHHTLKLPNDFKFLRFIYTIKSGYQYFYCQQYTSETCIYLPTHDLMTGKKIRYPDVLSVEYVPYSEEEKQEIMRKINNHKT